MAIMADSYSVPAAGLGDVESYYVSRPDDVSENIASSAPWASRDDWSKGAEYPADGP